MAVDQIAISLREHGRIRANSVVQSMCFLSDRRLNSEDRFISIARFS